MLFAIKKTTEVIYYTSQSCLFFYHINGILKTNNNEDPILNNNPGIGIVLLEHSLGMIFMSLALKICLTPLKCILEIE